MNNFIVYRNNYIKKYQIIYFFVIITYNIEIIKK